MILQFMASISYTAFRIRFPVSKYGGESGADCSPLAGGPRGYSILSYLSQTPPPTLLQHA